MSSANSAADGGNKKWLKQAVLYVLECGLKPKQAIALVQNGGGDVSPSELSRALTSTVNDFADEWIKAETAKDSNGSAGGTDGEEKNEQISVDGGGAAMGGLLVPATLMNGKWKHSFMRFEHLNGSLSHFQSKLSQAIKHRREKRSLEDDETSVDVPPPKIQKTVKDDSTAVKDDNMADNNSVDVLPPNIQKAAKDDNTANNSPVDVPDPEIQKALTEDHLRRYNAAFAFATETISKMQKGHDFIVDGVILSMQKTLDHINKKYGLDDENNVNIKERQKLNMKTIRRNISKGNIGNTPKIKGRTPNMMKLVAGDANIPN